MVAETTSAKSEGEIATRIRMEAQRSNSRVLGEGISRTLMTGYTFRAGKLSTAEVNQEYLLMQTLLFVRDNAQHSGGRTNTLPFHPF